MEAIRGRSLPSAPGAVLGAALVTILAVFVAWPVLSLLAPALDARTGDMILAGFGTTAGVAFASTAVAVPLAAALAWLAARAPGAASRALAGAMVAPLVLPPFAAALAVRFVLDAFGAAPTSATGAMIAVAIAQVVTLLPHAFAIVRNAMRRIDVELEDAAMSLGATPAAALSQVTLVLARPGLGCAALVVLALALADVASPLAVGGAAPFLGAGVVAAAQRGDVAQAAAGAVALAVPCVLAWLAALRAGWTRLAALPLDGGRRPAAAVSPGVAGPAMTAATVVLVALYTLVPLAAIRPHDAAVVTSVTTSVSIATAVAIVGTPLAFAFAVVAVRIPMRAARRVRWSALAAAGIPGVALALGYVVACDVAPASAPLWLPIVALAVWKLPTAVVVLTRRLRAHDAALEEVAVSLGADNVTIARRVLAPLLAPALAAAFLDLFVQALASAGVLVLVAPHVSASASALTRVAAGDVAGSAALVTALALVMVVVVLARAWLAPREPFVLLPA